MTKQQKVLAGTGVAVVMAAGIYVATRTAAAPASSFTVNTAPYTQTFGTVNSARYAGRWIVVKWQWGFIAANVDTPSLVAKRNGAWTSFPAFMPGTILVAGDCHASFANYDVSTSWVVAPNQSAPQCDREPGDTDVEGLQVWSGPPGFQWKGLIEARIRGNNQTRIVGDLAYVRNGSRDEWFVFDLPALTVRPGLVPGAEVPPWAPQANIDGYTYTLTPIHPTPIPSPYLGPKVLRFDRQGGAPPPTPTNAHPFDDWVYDFVARGYSAGCGNDQFCPDRDIRAQEWGPWWTKAGVTGPMGNTPPDLQYDHPITRAEATKLILRTVVSWQYVPPPCVPPGTFTDVPCGP